MGTEIAVISQTLSLIKGLTGLLSDSRTDHRLVFNDVVRPLYENLTPIASSYRVSLKKLRHNLENEAVPLPEVLKNLDVAREGIVMSRAAILGALEGAANTKPEHGHRNGSREDFLRFLLAIRSFFYDDPLEYSASVMSVFRDDIVVLIKGGKELQDRFATTRQELASLVDLRCSDMERQWIEVSRAYGELKQHYFRL